MQKIVTSTQATFKTYPCDIAKRMYKHVLHTGHGIGKDTMTEKDLLYSMLEKNRCTIEFFAMKVTKCYNVKHLGINPSVNCVNGCPSGAVSINIDGAPNFVPSPGSPTFVINNQNELYYYDGDTWVCLNCGSTGALLQFASDADAILFGLVSGQRYILSLQNIYGLPFGIEKIIE